MAQENINHNGHNGHLPTGQADGGIKMRRFIFQEITRALIIEERLVFPANANRQLGPGHQNGIAHEGIFATTTQLRAEHNSRVAAERLLRRQIKAPGMDADRAETARDETIIIKREIVTLAEQVRKDAAEKRTPGEKGNPGKDGGPGANGKDGKSTYQIALDHGFIGNEQKWLDSLKGIGTVGVTGLTGADGATGPRGLKGEKAKLSWVPGAVIGAVLGTIAIIVAANAGDGKTIATGLPDPLHTERQVTENMIFPTSTPIK